MDKLPPGVTLIALPYTSKEGFFGAFVQSLVTAIFSKTLGKVKVMFIGDHTQVAARNAACRDALEFGAEWLWFIDSDMDFPPDTLARLKALDADIACTDMWSRGWPSFRTVMRLGEPTLDGQKACYPLGDDATGVQKIDCCGMACTLIRVSLIERMREHFKDQPWFWSGAHGEDATFCFKASEVGATMKCDLDVVAGHWGTTRMAGQDYTRDARNQPMKPEEIGMLKRMGVRNLTEEGVV